MKSLAEAIERLEGLSLTRRAERVSLAEARGRLLSEPISARHEAPRWSASAMDGYAINWAAELARGLCEGSPLQYRVTQVIPAGYQPAPLTEGSAARIMTGAALPEGADTVILQENVTPSSGAHSALNQTITVDQRPRRVGEHVRLRGEEYSSGARLLEEGQRLSPPALALCASQGLASLPVWARPRVAILSTGDELREPGEELKRGEIYASNGALLRALVEEAGGLAFDCGVAQDSPEETRAGFERALATRPDLILSTGGVSVGDFDPVKGVLADLGATLDFWKVRMKPGKPLALGSLAGTPVLALPGNPVSAAVSYLLFARPLIRRALGEAPERARLSTETLPLCEPLGKRHGRAELMRVVRAPYPSAEQPQGLGWRLAGNQSSAWLSPLARADALLMLPEEPIEWAAGRLTEALRLPWSDR